MGCFHVSRLVARFGFHGTSPGRIGPSSKNATYVCDRAGEVEVCIDPADGACAKTLCDNIVCPEDRRERSLVSSLTVSVRERRRCGFQSGVDLDMFSYPRP